MIPGGTFLEIIELMLKLYLYFNLTILYLTDVHSFGYYGTNIELHFQSE